MPQHRAALHVQVIDRQGTGLQIIESAHLKIGHRDVTPGLDHAAASLEQAQLGDLPEQVLPGDAASVVAAIKDMVVRDATMRGFDSPYVPGWDCHGLPIEHQVEMRIGKAGVAVDLKAFRRGGGGNNRANPNHGGGRNAGGGGRTPFKTVRWSRHAAEL